MAALSFQQDIVRVVHLEVVQGRPLNALIPNTCLQQPMSGKPGLPLGKKPVRRTVGQNETKTRQASFPHTNRLRCGQLRCTQSFLLSPSPYRHNTELLTIP